MEGDSWIGVLLFDLSAARVVLTCCHLPCFEYLQVELCFGDCAHKMRENLWDSAELLLTSLLLFMIVLVESVLAII